MPTRTATAHWEGDFKRGGGSVALGSGAFEGPYNFSGRFEDGAGTNPEELLGAAHAACFAMALSVALTTAGNPPEALDVQAHVTIAQVEGAFEITKIDLDLKGKVAGIDEAAFNEAAQAAKAQCPLSKALAAVKEINLNATFET
jgi:osmotically inducible protein OsmC